MSTVRTVVMSGRRVTETVNERMREIGKQFTGEPVTITLAPRNILALDLATTTGFAATLGEDHISGVVSFPVIGKESRGMRFARFNHWLYTWKDRQLELVVYEKPIPFHSSQAASELAYGFATRVQEFAARHHIECRAVQNNVIKKFATNHGGADKQAMVAAAQALKKGVKDHNESDALWLLEFAKHNLGERFRDDF